MFTQAVLVSILAALSTASPTFRRAGASTTFQGEVLHNGNTEVNLKSIVAHDRYFYVGSDATTTVCNPSESDSTYGNQTAFNIVHGPAGSTGLMLYTATPEGSQNVYVLANGGLYYTAPGAQSPSDAYFGPFSYTAQDANGGVGRLMFEEKGFLACPVATAGYYQIYAAAITPEGADQHDCIDIAIATTNYNGPAAYEYATTV